jgi:hypothetical protein
LEHPAFDLLNPLAEMRVAGIHLAPGIEHSDDRFVLEVLIVEPNPFESRTVSEASQIIRSKPAMGTEFTWVIRGIHRWVSVAAMNSEFLLSCVKNTIAGIA